MKQVESVKSMQRLKSKKPSPESQGSAGVYFNNFWAHFSSAYSLELSLLLGITPVTIMR